MPTPEDINTVDAPVIVDDVEGAETDTPTALNSQARPQQQIASIIPAMTIPPFEKVS